MPLIRATVTMPTKSTLPKDRVTNTFWFNNETGDPYAAVLPGIVDLLEAFYAQAYETNFMGNWISISGTSSIWVSFVNWDDPSPRIATDIFMPDSAWGFANTVIPTEVSAVLSFHAVPVSGLSQARRRGRVYLPGIIPSMLTQNPAGWYPEFSTTFLGDLLLAASSMASVAADGGLPWHVYSRVNQSSAPVVGGWVDDSPDTQRRRSVEAVSRSLWEIS